MYSNRVPFCFNIRSTRSLCKSFFPWFVSTLLCGDIPLWRAGHLLRLIFLALIGRALLFSTLVGSLLFSFASTVCSGAAATPPMPRLLLSPFFYFFPHPQYDPPSLFTRLGTGSSFFHEIELFVDFFFPLVSALAACQPDYLLPPNRFDLVCLGWLWSLFPSFALNRTTSYLRPPFFFPRLFSHFVYSAVTGF